MKRTISMLSCIGILSITITPIANATLIANPDGLRVYDTYLKVTWLADANLPIATQLPNGQAFDGRLDYPPCTHTVTTDCIDSNGAMSFDTATDWIQTLNGLDGGTGFLRHHTWTIPRVPLTDPDCTVKNWGYNCMDSALGSLYYRSLPSGDNIFGFTYPDTAVPIPDNQVGPFRNFQPYLYWTSTAGNGTGKANGETTFSFNTGWQGSNHKFHYMYALPMIPGKVDRPYYIPSGPNDLQISNDGELVWDPDFVDPTTGVAGVTWLADANLAKTQKFGLDNCRSHHRLCINPDGSMKYTTAETWLTNMKNYDNGINKPKGWLGESGWMLPPADPKGGCDLPFFHCKGGPMGELYFNELGLSQGAPVFQLTNNNVGPFYDLQPYLYWACGGPDPCQGAQATPPSPPMTNQSWSFSFGNGFQGTDLKANNLYVMVYYPQMPAEALDEGIRDELANYPAARSTLLSAAAQISSATTYREMLSAFSTFQSEVEALRGSKLTSAESDYLIALAAATVAARSLQTPPQPSCAPHCI
jgi:hypothetical protein